MLNHVNLCLLKHFFTYKNNNNNNNTKSCWQITEKHQGTQADPAPDLISNLSLRRSRVSHAKAKSQ